MHDLEFRLYKISNVARHLHTLIFVFVRIIFGDKMK